MENSANSDIADPAAVGHASSEPDGVGEGASLNPPSSPTSLLDPRLYDGMSQEERIEQKLDYLLSFVETMTQTVGPLMEGMTNDPLGTLAGLMLNSEE